MLHLLSCLFRSLLAVAVSQNFLVFDGLDSVEECWSDILQDVSLLKFVWCFPYHKTGVRDYWEEDCSGRIPFSHPIKGAFYQHDVRWSRLVSATCLRQCLPCFSMWSYPLPRPLSIFYSLEEVIMCRPHLRPGELCFLSREENMKLFT